MLQLNKFGMLKVLTTSILYKLKVDLTDANGNALKALAMMTNTEMLAGSAKYIAYAPWRKSSIGIMEKGEPWYKDGKTNMVPQMPTAPQNTKNYFPSRSIFTGLTMEQSLVKNGKL